MLADTYHKTRSAALAEVQRRREQTMAEQMITMIEDSPYGGYRVKSMPAEFLIDRIGDIGGMSGGLANRRAKLFA